MKPHQTAAADQAVAAARDAIEPIGGVVVDSRDALLTIVISKDAKVQLSGTTRDWTWCAAACREIAALFDARAAEASS